MSAQFVEEKILPEMESFAEELNLLLQKLIRIRSYSGEEKEVVEFIVGKMKEFGFDEARSDSLGNAVGRIGSGPVKILFDAHIDTVKVTENEKWAFPPFDGVIKDGKIYGRGAVDEKAAMAGFLLAGKLLKSMYKENFPFTLYVVGSVMEEDADGYPLQHIIEQEGIRPDYVLLGEPTDMKVYRGHRGRIELKVTTSGISAHGAHNEKGDNAIYKMAPILQEIEKLNHDLPVKEPLGKGSITVSQISSRAPSLCSVSDFCQIHLDRRMTIGEDRETALAEIREIVSRLGIPAEVEIPRYHGKSWKGTGFDIDAWFPTWIYEESHPLVKAGLTAGEKILSGPAGSGTWKFSTNGVATAGKFNIPTIGFAPGKEELAHSSAEEIVLTDLMNAARFYVLFPFVLTESL